MKKILFWYFILILLTYKKAYTTDCAKNFQNVVLYNCFSDQSNLSMKSIFSTQFQCNDEINNSVNRQDSRGQCPINQNCNQCQPCALRADDVDIPCSKCDPCKNLKQNFSLGSCTARNCSNNIVCPLPPVKCRTCPTDCILTCNRPRTTFIPRSQGANTARELVGWQDFIYRCAPGCIFFVNAHTFEYTHSFRPERIARYLFGTNQLNFSGSLVSDRSDCEIISDYFGLSPNFRGTLRVEPSIQNYIFDNQFFFGCNRLCDGLYFRAHMPIVHTIWNLQACQCNLSDSFNCTGFPACSMSEDQTRSTCSIFKALSGDFTFGDLKKPIQFGKLIGTPTGRNTKTGVADIDLIFGWNFWQNPVSHFGIYVQTVVPTGNKSNPKLIFAPVVGNGKHWEAGGGISGHLLLWTKDADQTLTAYIEGNVTHLFKNTQCRSFDLCPNGPLSRYLILKEFEQVDDQFIYKNNLINAINFTTRPIESTISVKGDVSAKLSYRSQCYNVDIGYNFYGQTMEKVKIICSSKIDQRLFGIKGTSGVCALEYAVTDTLPSTFLNLQNKTPINSTESNATISTSGHGTRPSIDNPVSVPASCNNCAAVTWNSRQTGFAIGPDVILAQDSQPPVLISVNDLDINSGRVGAIATHKVFAHINYIFNNRPGYPANYLPYFGVGGEFEVEALACNEETSLNQWGVWFKFGASF